MGAIEANRLSLMELDRSKKLAHVLGVLLSCRLDEQRKAVEKLQKKGIDPLPARWESSSFRAFRYIDGFGQKQLRNSTDHLSDPRSVCMETLVHSRIHVMHCITMVTQDFLLLDSVLSARSICICIKIFSPMSPLIAKMSYLQLPLLMLQSAVLSADVDD